jgi:YggT family protein
MTNQILDALLLVLNLLMWALVGRAILSWIDPGARWPVTRVLADATEPLISPIRRVIPPIGMIDISFIVAIILLQVLQRLLISALG